MTRSSTPTRTLQLVNSPHSPVLPLPSPAFSDLGLVEPLLRAVREEGYDTPTPIQAQAIPYLLEGRDLLGCARTGTGKTAAFVLPMLQRLTKGGPHHEGRQHRSTSAKAGSARALVLVPTRELAAQVRQSLVTYGRHLHASTAVVYGGVGQGPQVRALSRGVDVLVATPGRLLDLMGQRHARLDHVEILVLDEADQMLDLGFLPAMRRILEAVPAQRQTLLFSATMPPAIAALARKVLSRPAEVFVSPVASTVDEVDQKVYFVDPKAKLALLLEVLSDPTVRRALVFTRTKRGADRVARGLVQNGIHAAAIHGNKAQNARERALEGFRRGRTPVLVATDIAARGIDVDDITHVVNYELPNVPESYVHRIGRTARAGNTGVAISLCGPEERAYLHDIERLTRRKVSVAGNRLSHSARPANQVAARPSGHGAAHSHHPRRGGGRAAPPRRNPHAAWTPRPAAPKHAEPERKAPFGAGA
jgi:ATP-dependent RNA helicase RhlE